MNPAKLLEEILSTLQKYAPIVVIHSLLLVWLSARVLDPALLPDGNTLWVSLQAQIDSLLKAIGLSLELWYVIVALLIAYLAVFRWARTLVSQLPILRVTYITRYEPRLLAQAGVVLKLRPELWRVAKSLGALVEKYNKEVEETNRPHPYQWQFDRVDTWSRYYGTLLVALFAAVAWAMQGGSLAYTVADVWKLAVWLAIICLIVRWKLQREIAYGNQQLASWALREHERRSEDQGEDPLSWERRRLIESQAEFDLAMRKHPASIIVSLLYRLPERLGELVRARLKTPNWYHGDDWDILASHTIKYKDENKLPPKSLRVDEFVDQFSELLECSGAGLCMLTPDYTGLAPSARGYGAEYCFAERKHGGYVLPVRLWCKKDFSDCEFRIRSYGDTRGLIAEVGEHPVRLLAQGDFPDYKFYALTGSRFDDNNWPSDDDKGEKSVDTIKLVTRIPVKPGSSYLIRSQSPHGTQAVVVFQCFQVANCEKILLAWRMLHVYPRQEKAPDVLPWWQLPAWKDLWKQKKS